MDIVRGPYSGGLMILGDRHGGPVVAYRLQ
jgi:hypothetical protein